MAAEITAEDYAAISAADLSRGCRRRRPRRRQPTPSREMARSQRMTLKEPDAERAATPMPVKCFEMLHCHGLL